MFQKLIDKKNNFEFDPAEIMLVLCGLTILVIWLKALSTLWECSLLSLVP